MAGRMPRATGTEVLRALERDGWYVARIKGSHHILNHPRKRGRPNVAVHAGVIVDPRTLNRILKDAELTPDELRDLL